jgi:hypothetical protein
MRVFILLDFYAGGLKQFSEVNLLLLGPAHVTNLLQKKLTILVQHLLSKESCGAGVRTGCPILSTDLFHSKFVVAWSRPCNQFTSKKKKQF